MSAIGETMYLNGEFIHKNDRNRLSVFDYGFNFGAGIYDIAFVYESKVFQLDEHVARFMRGAKELKLDFGVSPDKLKSLINDLAKRNGVNTGFIYFQASYGGYEKRSHVFPAKMDKPTLLLFTQELAPYQDDCFLKGIDLCTTADKRWHNCHIKTTMLLPNVLATNEAKADGYYDAIFVRDGNVMEGTSYNLFIVKDGVIITAPCERGLVLVGVTRQALLAICRKKGLAYEERNYTLKELYDADEVFATSTTKEVMPVRSVDKRMVKLSPGPVTKRLMLEFMILVERQTGIKHKRRVLLSKM